MGCANSKSDSPDVRAVVVTQSQVISDKSSWAAAGTYPDRGDDGVWNPTDHEHSLAAKPKSKGCIKRGARIWLNEQAILLRASGGKSGKSAAELPYPPEEQAREKAEGAEGNWKRQSMLLLNQEAIWCRLLAAPGAEPAVRLPYPPGEGMHMMATDGAETGGRERSGSFVVMASNIKAAVAADGQRQSQSQLLLNQQAMWEKITGAGTAAAALPFPPTAATHRAAEDGKGMKQREARILIHQAAVFKKLGMNASTRL